MELAVAIAVSWALVLFAAAGRRSGLRASKQEEAVSRAWIDGFRAGSLAAREDAIDRGFAAAIAEAEREVARLRDELRHEGFDR